MIVVNPHLEGGRAAEDLRIDLSPNVGPINGCALCQPVDAHALMCPRTRIRSRFPEPQDGSVPAFVHLNKTAFASRDLQCLTNFHDALRISAYLFERRHTIRRESGARETPAVSRSLQWRGGPVESPFDFRRKRARRSPHRQPASFGGRGPG